MWTEESREKSHRERMARLETAEGLCPEYVPGEWVWPNKRRRGCTCEMCWYRYSIGQWPRCEGVKDARGVKDASEL